MIKKFFIFLFFLNINYLYSQSSEGEIEDAQILIEKNTKIILPKVDKSIDKIILENKTIKKKKFEFDNIKFKDLPSKNIIDKILRDNTSYFDYKNSFIDLKAGNYSSYIFHTNPHFRSGNKFSIYSDIYVKLNSKGLKLPKVSGENINDINLLIDYKYNTKSKISSHINFNNYGNGYFGFTNSGNISLDDDDIDKLRFGNNTLYYKIDWETIEKKYQYNISYSTKIFNENYYSEIDHNFNANILFPFSKSLVSLKPSYNFYDLKINNDLPSLLNNVSFNLIDIPLIFDYNSNNFYFSINALYQILNRNFKDKSTKTSFSPSIKFKYSLDNISLKLNASRINYFDKYSNELVLMPFLYDQNILNQFNYNKEFYRIKGGVDLKILNNTTLSLNFESVKLKGNFNYRLYKGDYMFSEIKNPIFLYTIKRDDNTEIRNYISISFYSILSKSFESKLNLLYTIYEQKDVFQPLYYINLINTYSENDLSISIGGNFELENYGINFKDELFKMKSYIDIYIESSYNISDNLQLNINFNNILNRYNERFFMYPELGFNFIAGIKWIF